MALLVAGMLLFTFVHLLPAVAPDMRTGLAAKLGDNAYRALFSAVILLSLVVFALSNYAFQGGLVFYNE